jgi:hypothetical protein
MLSPGWACSWQHSRTFQTLPHMTCFTHSNVARAGQQRGRHPHGNYASQRRPFRWQGARQLVVMKDPAFVQGRRTEQRVDFMHSHRGRMATCPP